ncbi:MAG: ester cyclase [Puniceicoccales bacterium]
MSPTELARVWFDRVWNQQEEPAIFEMLSADCMIEGLNMTEPGPVGFLPFYRGFINAFDAIRIELIELKELEDSSFGHGVFTGIHQRTRTPITIEFSFSARWKDGKVVEARNVIDYLPMLSQLHMLGQEAIAEVLKTDR